MHAHHQLPNGVWDCSRGFITLLLTILAIAGTTAATPAAASSAGQAAEPSPPAGGESTAADVFAPLDVFNLEWAAGPQVSPDGKTIAYTRNGFDIMTDRRNPQIWLIDANGERHRPLADLPGSGARFAPDGRRIAFVAPTDAGAEIFMHWRDDNRTARISRLPESPANLTWSPDGRWLAFTMFKPGSTKPLVPGPTPPEGAKWAPRFKVYESVQYRADGRGYLRVGFTHVYAVPADGGAPRQITSGDFHHAGGISWSADGTSLYVSANRNDNWALETLNTDIFEVNVTTGDTTPVTDRNGPDFNPLVSPNGRYLAYLGYDDNLRGYENARLYVKDLRSGIVDNLTEGFDRSVSAPVWSDDSRGLHVMHDDSGLGRVRYVNLSGRVSDVVADLGGTAMTRPYSGGGFHAAAGVVAYTRSRPDRPADLAVVRRASSRTLTNLNPTLAHTSLATVETIRFPSSLDGREVEAWVAKPPGFDPDETYPLILEIHGGPFAAYGPHFSAEVQLYAAAGYLVLYVNPRGSTSYGDEFANLIHHAYPGGDYDDLISAVDHTIDMGWADPDQLYVTGGSGGGILSAWIVTQTDRFRAAVAAKPVINWYSFVLTSDAYPSYWRYWFGKKPWEDPDAYLSRSPLHFADRVSTPTMLLTGESDHRTPISEAEQFYQALKLNEVDSALVRVPEASHGIANRPSHLIGKVQHVLAWFERYAPKPPAATGETAL